MPARNSSTPQLLTPLAVPFPRACTVLLRPCSNVELLRTLKANCHLTVTVNRQAELSKRILSFHGEARCHERELGKRRSEVVMLGTRGIVAATGRKPWWWAAAAVRLWWLSKAFCKMG
ncbi:hypothetical protein NL676_008399 [Syzygium grande]|nr:hypothetical protein NL676_008399 [Syzygium grande]